MGYSDKVIDHLENPRNVGSLDRDAEDVGTGMVGAPACGDVMKLQLKINDSGIIEDAKFKTFGCGSAIASSPLVTTMVKGKTIDDALTISNADIAQELSLPPVKIHCSVLAEDAIKARLPNQTSIWGITKHGSHHDRSGSTTGSDALNEASDSGCRTSGGRARWWMFRFVLLHGFPKNT